MRGLISILLFFSIKSLFAQNVFPASGNVGVGTSSPGAKLEIRASAGQNILSIADGRHNQNTFRACSDVSWQGSFFQTQRSRGSVSSPSQVQANDALGFFDFWGHNGSSYARAAQLAVLTKGVASNNLISADILFRTTNLSGNYGDRMILTGDGKLGIGTNNPLELLTVNGNILAEEVKIVADITMPDYVFEEDYDLLPLDNLRSYITENKHLPGVPSAKEFKESGISVGEMNKILLEKVEELTLYILELEEKISKLEEK